MFAFCAPNCQKWSENARKKAKWQLGPASRGWGSAAGKKKTLWGPCWPQKAPLPCPPFLVLAVIRGVKEAGPGFAENPGDSLDPGGIHDRPI